MFSTLRALGHAKPPYISAPLNWTRIVSSSTGRPHKCNCYHNAVDADGPPEHSIWSGPRVRPQLPGVAPLSLAATKLLKQFRNSTETPLTVLKSRLDADAVTIDILRACMVEAFHQRIHSPPDTERPHDAGLGRLALEWLWRDDARWATIMLSTDELCRALCYYLWVEGLQEYAVEWIMTADIPDHDGTASSRDKHVWRGRLLRDLLRAKVSLDWRTKSLDGAIECFMEISDRKHRDTKLEKPSEKMQRLSLVPAINFVVTTLELGRHSASPAPFRRFKDTVHIIMKRADVASRYNRSVLQLYDPATPLPELYFLHAEELFHNSGGGPTSGWSRTQEQGLVVSLMSASDLLRVRGRDQDAQWAIEAARRVGTARTTDALRKAQDHARTMEERIFHWQAVTPNICPSLLSSKPDL